MEVLVVRGWTNISRLLTIKEVQEIINIKKDKAYKLVKTDGFPSIQIGNTIRVPEDELEKWIKKYTYGKLNGISIV